MIHLIDIDNIHACIMQMTRKAGGDFRLFISVQTKNLAVYSCSAFKISSESWCMDVACYATCDEVYKPLETFKLERKNVYVSQASVWWRRGNGRVGRTKDTNVELDTR